MIGDGSIGEGRFNLRHPVILDAKRFRKRGQEGMVDAGESHRAAIVAQFWM